MTRSRESQPKATQPRGWHDARLVGTVGVVVILLVLAAIALRFSGDDPTGGEEVDPVDAAIGYREHIGMRSDRLFVESLYNSDDPFIVESEKRWFIRVTPDEHAHLVALRNNVRDASGLVGAYGRSLASDAYAGLTWNDQLLSSRKLTVSIARDFDEHVPAIEQLFPYPDVLTIVESPMSRDEFLAAMEEIRRLVRDEPERFDDPGWGLAQSEVDGVMRIRVGVEGRVEKAQAFFDDHFGPGIVEVEQEFMMTGP